MKALLLKLVLGKHQTINYLTLGMQQTFLHFPHIYISTLQQRIHLNNRYLPTVASNVIIWFSIFDVNLNVNDVVLTFSNQIVFQSK